MKKNKKLKIKKLRILAVFLVIVIMLGFFYFRNRNELQVVTVVSEIGGYNYNLESNATRIFKKYYKELEKELDDNKITNKNIGGVQFIHSNLKDKFISESSATIYKYVESNLYGNRKQKLPEVNKVNIKDIKEIKYDNNGYKDVSGYEVELSIGYVKDYDYPEEVVLSIIHEENKLVIVEIK